MLRWKEHPAYNTMTVVIGWYYCHFFLPHCFLPFPLLFASNYIPAYTNLLFIEVKSPCQVLNIFKIIFQYLFFLGWPLWGKLLKKWLLSENVKPSIVKEETKVSVPKSEDEKKED